MSTDTNVKQVILNKLTKAQYDDATKSATELYLTPDEPASITNLGPVKVDGATINATADGMISVDQTKLTTKQNTLSNMSVAEGTTGTATTQRSVRADYLKQIIEYYVDNQAVMSGPDSDGDGTKGLVPAPLTGDENKFLKGDGTWSAVSGSVNTDNKSINTNSNSQIQTIGIIDQNNTTNAIKTWTGTKVQYDAIQTKDSNTLYSVTDDYDIKVSLLETLYPVGSIYITTTATCPLSTLIVGSTWELVSSGRVLQGSDANHAAGTTINAGLPNITGTHGGIIRDENQTRTGAFSKSQAITNAATGNASKGIGTVIFDASDSNAIYGNSDTVQPPAYVVNIFRRTA